MINHKIIEILSTFSKDEIKRFREYLNSPFFNKSAKLIKLFEVLIEFYPEFDSKNFTEEKIFKKVNPGLNFNISTFRNLLFDLANAAEDFLTVINIMGRDIEKADYLRDELFQRNLSKQLESVIKKSQVMLNEVKNFDSGYYLNNFKLTTDILNFNLVFKPRSGIEYLDNVIYNFTENGKSISQFFAKEICRIYDNLNTQNTAYDINSENNFVFGLFKTMDFEKILKYIAENSGSREVAVVFNLYLANYVAFSKMDNIQYYYDYKDLLLKEIKNLEIDYIRTHTINLHRYCVIKSKLNNSDEAEIFKKERFDIYNLILENKFYKTDVAQYIPAELYRPALKLGLELKKYTWAFNFIKKFKSELPPERRDNFYNFSCAEYYFCRGKYAEAMKSFHKVKFDHFMFKVDMKNMMLKTYYELGLFDNALSLIDSYKHFLANDKTLSAIEKRINKNFINAVQKMIQYKTSGNRTGKYLIETEFKKEMINKEWAMEKFEQLDRKYVESA